MKDRAFRLASLLSIREAAEEQQKRRVATCSKAVTESTRRIEDAELWINASMRGCSVTESASAELAFVTEAARAVELSRDVEGKRRVQLEGDLKTAIGMLREAHQQAEILKTLRAKHLEELMIESKRQEQSALDEVFRLCNGSAVGTDLESDAAH